MSAELIIDGRVIALEEEHAIVALDRLEAAPSGDVLVALSYADRVLVRWIDQDATARIVPNIKTPHAKPTQKRCPWFYEGVEAEFDQVMIEHADEVRDLHETTKAELTSRGKRPESYQRWLRKLRRRWVRTVATHGRRVSDLESLA